MTPLTNDIFYSRVKTQFGVVMMWRGVKNEFLFEHVYVGHLLDMYRELLVVLLC